MMLTSDIILEIAYRVDFKTTFIMFSACKFIVNSTSFWKNKCKLWFGQSSYVDFLAGPENFLIAKNKNYAIVIDNEDITCKGYVYEYTNINYLKNMFWENRTPIRIEFRKFIIVQTNHTNTARLVGYTETCIDAENLVQTDFRDLKIQNKHTDTGYIIINMRNVAIMPLCGKVFRQISRKKRHVLSFHEDSGDLVCRNGRICEWKGV
jgi:hypothetical protein